MKLSRLKLLSLPEAITFGVLILIVFLFPLLSRDTFSIGLMGYTLAFSLFALSIFMVISLMGEIPLGHSMYYGLGMYVVGILTRDHAVPFLLATLIAMVAVFILAMIVGFITLRLTGAYFAIVSWGLAAVAVVVMISAKDITGGALGLTRVPQSKIGDLSLANPTTYATVSGVTVLVVLIALALLRRTSFGRRVNGSRINRNLVRAAGANTYADRVLMFSLSAPIAAVGGALSLQYLRIPTPDLLAVTTSVEALVMVLIGGVGFLLGPIIGAYFFGMLPEEFELPSDVRQIVVAVVVLLIVLLAPKGLPEIVGRVAKLFRRDGRASRSRAEAGAPEIVESSEKHP